MIQQLIREIDEGISGLFGAMDRALADGPAGGLIVRSKGNGVEHLKAVILRHRDQLASLIEQENFLSAAFTAADLLPSALDLDQMGIEFRNNEKISSLYEFVLDRSVVLAEELESRL